MQEQMDCSFELVLPKEGKAAEQRVSQAKKMLIYYQQTAIQDTKRNQSLKKQARKCSNDKGNNDRDVAEADLPICQGKSLQDKDCLLILKGLSLGESVNQIYKENKSMHYYPMEKLKNIPQMILLRLSKILIDLLPNSQFPTPKKLKLKYFKTNQMLQYYHYNGLDLCPTFDDLHFIGNWQKINKEYLRRGYSHDFLPEDIKQRLASIATVFEQIKKLHSSYENSHSTKQKLKSNRNFLTSHRTQRLSATMQQSSMET